MIEELFLAFTEINKTLLRTIENASASCCVHWGLNNRLTGTRNCHVPSDVHGIFTSKQCLRKLLGDAVLEQLLWVLRKGVNQAIFMF